MLNKLQSVAVIQSSYVPWRGYFDIIDSVDTFVLFDCVQYTKRDWRNRNKVKSKSGVSWLTIPVNVKGSFKQTIYEVQISEADWGRKHFESLRHAYGRLNGFKYFEGWVEDLYRRAGELKYLSDVNELFTREICEVLKIETRIIGASELETVDGKSERLLGICKQVGAGKYVSGPSASSYLDLSLFAQNDVSVEFFEYGPYISYGQFGEQFTSEVSILDLLFHCGSASSDIFSRRQVD